MIAHWVRQCLSVTTRGADLSSYCVYTTQFVVMVHGIPINFVLTMIGTVVTFAVLVAVAVVGISVHIWRSNRSSNVLSDVPAATSETMPLAGPRVVLPSTSGRRPVTPPQGSLFG